MFLKLCALLVLTGCSLQPFNLATGSKTCAEEHSCLQVRVWTEGVLTFESPPGYGYCEPQAYPNPVRWLCHWWVQGIYSEYVFPASAQIEQRME